MKKQWIVFVVGATLLFFLCSLPAHALSITGTTDAQTLVNEITGPGITIVGTPKYVGIENQSGTFTGGEPENTSNIGFDRGIVLTTGNVNQIVGPNNADIETRASNRRKDSDDINTDLGRLGDAALDPLAGFRTHDAASLEFEFQFGDETAGGDLFFNFVFASEEYVNYVNSQFNDVFGFFVNGENVALVSGTEDPISVNTVNDKENPGFYRNNVNNTDGIPVARLDNHFDGLTTVITAERLGLDPDVTHAMKFAIADTFDGNLDAGVFIQAGTFSSEKPPSESAPGPDPPAPVPEPATLLLLSTGLVGLLGFGRKKLSTRQRTSA